MREIREKTAESIIDDILSLQVAYEVNFNKKATVIVIGVNMLDILESYGFVHRKGEESKICGLEYIACYGFDILKVGHLI